MTYWKQMQTRGTYLPSEKEDHEMVAMGFDVEVAEARSRDRLECLTEALVARATHTVPRDRLARAYAETAHLFSSIGHARLMATGLDRGLHPVNDRGEVIRLAFTTSDGAFAITSAGSKVLLGVYSHARAAYRRICARRDFPDFKSTSLVRPAEFSAPLQVGESGEVKVGGFIESYESGFLLSYGSIWALSRPALVNDEVRVFGDIFTAAGLRCVDLEDYLVFSTLTSGTSTNGPTMRDGAQFFATSRGNLAASGAVISATTISAGRAAMMGMTSPNGIKSVAVPRYLVCPPSLLTLAETELAKLNPGADPAQRITPICSPNLSGTSWYLFSDPAQLPALVFSYLEGSPGPIVVGAPDFETEGLKFKVTLDFGVTAVDPRGAWKNPGA